MTVRRLLATSILATLLAGLAPFADSAGTAQAKGRKATPRSSAKRGKATKPSKPSRTSSARRGKAAPAGKLSKKERQAASRKAKAAAAARRRAELARLAAIRRVDETLRAGAAASIATDDLTNEDMHVRSVVLGALGKRAGTVVVMDPNTGRVLSIVNQRMAIANGFKPCSTFKPVVALAALDANLAQLNDVRTLRACHCEIEMDDALAYSNNEYFQQLGRQLGLERLTAYAREMGFGERTGINLPGEVPGALPTQVSAAGLGRVASHGDGIRLTAVQLASFVSAIANGGSLYQPQVVAPGKRFIPVLKRQLRIRGEHRQAVLEGMTGAVNYGTAKKARDVNEQVAGKTGSCLDLGSWLGLFESFSSLQNPNLAIVVITRGSTARGPRSADVAGQIYRQLSPRYGSTASRPRRIGAETPSMNASQ